MEERLSMGKLKEEWKRLKPYRYALGLLVLGVALLLMPVGGEKKVGTEPATEEQWLQQVQAELSDTLSRVEGAGRLTLMLSVRTPFSF